MVVRSWSLPYASSRQPIFARNVVATSQPLAVAGRHRDAAGRRQCRRRRARHRDCADRHRAVQQRHRQRPLRHRRRPGRARRAQCLGPRAGRGHARALRRPERDAAPRLGGGDDPGRRRRLGGAFAALRRAALRRPVRTGDPLRARRLPGLSGRCRQVGGRGPHLPADLGFAEHFLPRGRAPLPGEVFACPPMAASLAKIAATHGNAFYRGELAEAMVRHARDHGALHTLADFADHTVDWVTPLAQDYGGATVHEIPPNGQGIAAQMALGILASFDLAALPPDSVASQHLQIEAMKLAFADVHRYVGDPATMEASGDGAARPRLPRGARAFDRSRAGAGLRPRLAAEGRHRLPVRRRRRRHDGVADPVELHGLRLRRRRARAPASACRTAARAFRSRPGIRTRSAAASGRSTRSSRASSPATARRWPRSASWAARSSRRDTCRRWCAC